MLEPMRPRPTIPNCMPVLREFLRNESFETDLRPTMALRGQGLLYQALQFCQTRIDISSQMHPQSAASPLGQHLEVSARLRCLDNPKGVFLTWHRHIECIVACDLQKDSGIRPALVRLSSRVQKARPKAQTGGDAPVV